MVWVVEIKPEVESHPFGQTPCNVRVATEIKIDLECKSYHYHPPEWAIVCLVDIGKTRIYQGCNIICQDHLLKETDDDQFKSVPPLYLTGWSDFTLHIYDI